jgi:putative AbiEi antitoxin of type IV toxin-antitoxin system
MAQSQSGYFTTGQAATAGYSPQLLGKYIGNGRVVRVRRGIYRLVHFPASEHEDLVVAWLWAEQAGVFSHETALALHDLSDVLPAKLHMTLPMGWQHRRLGVPAGLVLHYADLSEFDRTGFSAVPITSVQRTLRDCLPANVSPELVRQAVLQARRRGLRYCSARPRLARSTRQSFAWPSRGRSNFEGLTPCRLRSPRRQPSGKIPMLQWPRPTS